MEKISILNWTIEFDYEKTKEHYRNHHYITEGCSCDDCKNYVEACDFVPSDMKLLSERLGIDLKKPSDLFYCTDYSDGTCLYWAGYDIVGKIIEGPEKIEEIVVNKNSETERKAITVPEKKFFTEGFEICFYTINPIIIGELKYPCITLDLNGKFIRVYNET
jgi:hypothetical protein